MAGAKPAVERRDRRPGAGCRAEHAPAFPRRAFLADQYVHKGAAALARKFQFGSDPRLRNHWPGSFTLGTLSSLPASIRRTLTLGILRHPPCHDRPRRACSSDDEVVLRLHLGRQPRLIEPHALNKVSRECRPP